MLLELLPIALLTLVEEANPQSMSGTRTGRWLNGADAIHCAIWSRSSDDASVSLRMRRTTSWSTECGDAESGGSTKQDQSRTGCRRHGAGVPYCAHRAQIGPQSPGQRVGPARYDERVTSPSWRCPLCNTLADEARAHLAEVHGVGGDRDRFGLRDAVRRQIPRPGHDADQEDDAADGVGTGAPERPSTPFEPPVWRRVPPVPPRRGRSSGPSRSGTDEVTEPGLTWRRARRPPSSRRPSGEPPEMSPAKPVPLPPDASVLRLVCETLDGVDAQVLRDRLLDLPGVESVALDLYARTADLYLDRRRATPPHLVAMSRERIRLPVRAAELHRAPEPGQTLGAGTLLFVIQ